jgi:hypothetical protein
VKGKSIQEGGAEQFTLTPGAYPVGPDTSGNATYVEATDALGLAFGVTELADRITHASDVRAALTLPAAITEKPANRIRGIVRLFVSERDDKPWFYDREGWQNYLDMMVTHRFNRLNLSFGLSYDFSTNLTDTYTFFMYPFFVNVPGYNVRAIAKGGQPLSAEEMQKNLDTLKFISDECAKRGLQSVLGIWTHNYTWNTSANATYTIEGLNAQTQAPYSRDAMKVLIDACPGLSGILLRTHGESGIPEGSYDLWKVVMSGVMGHKNADGSGRTIELELHAKTMTQEMINAAYTTNMPVTLSCKLWAEHMGLPYVQTAVREQEMPKRDAGGLMSLSNGSRNFLRYGIGDLLNKDRKYKVIHRVWPGTQRLLLWGDPAYAAEYGRAGAFAGMDGIDYFEPMTFRGRGGSGLLVPPSPDRSSYADAALKPGRDWEKYTYTFRLWGRLSYNPDAPAENWQRQTQAEFGRAAAPLESALANASRILPLWTTAHLPSAASDAYWVEVIYNMSLYDTGRAGPYNSEAPSPKVFGNVTSIDPQMFSSVNEYVDGLLNDKPMARYSPLVVATQLQVWAEKALAGLKAGQAARGSAASPVVSRLLIDVTIAAGLGSYLNHKLRAAMLWQLFNLSGHEPARTAALAQYRQARDAWAQLADTARVYLPDLPFGSRIYLRRHWSVRLADIDTDIANLPAKAAGTPGTHPAATIDKLIALVQNPFRVEGEAVARQHTPPKRFTPGEPVSLELRTVADVVRLHYRHVHQGERYVAVDAVKNGTTFTALIPAEYTQSPFPLTYYFEIRTGDKAAIFPGFREDFLGTPYFTIAQS